MVANLKALKRAFPKVCHLHADGMASGHRQGIFRAVYKAARESKVGVGGPDLLPYKRGRMGSSYSLIREIADAVPVGIAVQDGNYEHINPKTGKRVTITEQIEVAKEYLKADYIFWCTEEPYFSSELVPFMKSR